MSTIDDILSQKPALDELLEYVPIGDEWYALGILLKLNKRKLDEIHDLPDKTVTFKTVQMFGLYLDTYPTATRRQIIETLSKDVIGRSSLAKEYEKKLTDLYVMSGQPACMDIYRQSCPTTEQCDDVIIKQKSGFQPEGNGDSICLILPITEQCENVVVKLKTQLPPGGNQINGESIRHKLSTNEQCENIIVELQVLPGHGRSAACSGGSITSLTIKSYEQLKIEYVIGQKRQLQPDVSTLPLQASCTKDGPASKIRKME